MKFSILQQDLLPSLQTLSRSVGIRSTLPVLDNILLSAEKDRLKLSATNLEIGVIKNIACKVLEEGEITVPSKTLLEIISGLGQTKVEIESTQDLLSVQADKFKASLNTIPAAEFPTIPVSEGIEVKFPPEVIQNTQQILFAAAVDEGRPVLTGVLTEVKGGKLDLVATDGFRLAHRVSPVSKDAKPLRLLIPKKTYEELVRILPEEQVEEVGIATLQNQIVFNLGQTVVSSRLIEGVFPAWEKIIPTQRTTRCLIDKDVLLKGIKLSSVFAKSEAGVTVFSLSDSGLLLKSSAKELGSLENQLDAQIEGEKLEVAFNSKFLQDAVSAAPSSQLMLEFSGPLSATLLKPVGVEGLEYIVMPLRLS
ncbi:DNA polymerase III subunit beta [Candidatus Daviesbacteria bacterium RIFCSPLOWO2_01_FULL_39_12]|uniref:Beta sliding clamp n=1 Tax=Candidatus Daviesbacteria bacterium RIFCSPLOWO2_01_FULL_39_12 TaxID=1797785 RepID=A0A1F5KSJ4_9BACT|nr:MAG: DNA polymerase III subunit beta [Candidatus Daviesbacteria bacterium RIFCSPLOWO2_01_FULL_39_12]